MAHTAAALIITAESGFTRYLEEIRRCPMLGPREGYISAKSQREHGHHRQADRLVNDASRHTPIRDDDDSGDWRDWPVDEHDSQQAVLVESAEIDNRRAVLSKALRVLDTRERSIFEARRLTDKPMNLDALAEQFAISRERVREIEVRAFETVRNAVRHRMAATEPPAALVMF